MHIAIYVLRRPNVCFCRSVLANTLIVLSLSEDYYQLIASKHLFITEMTYTYHV